MLRRLLLTAVAVTGLAAVAAPVAGATPGDLFVLHAGHGALKRTGTAGRFALTLRDTGHVTSFTDRPRRRAGEQGLRGFVHQWKARGFTADPPNAALVDAGAPKGRDVVIVTLRRPRVLPGGHAVRFRARRIRAAEGALARFDQRADRRVARRFTGASLFVDDAADPPVQVLWTVQGLNNFGQFGVNFQTGALTEARLDHGGLQAGSLRGFLFRPSLLVLAAGNSGATVSFSTEVVPDNANVPGSVSFPPGTTVTATVAGGTPQTLPVGTFNLPV